MKSKPQGRLEGTLVGNILKTRLAVIAANWVFQGMRYMNGYEIGLKLILDSITAIFIYYFMHNKISTIPALAIAIIIAHTINWIINGHFFVLMRYVAPIPKTEQHFADFIDKLNTSALKWNSIDSVAIYGSYCRGNMHKYSDLDVRVITHPGTLNAINGALFCFTQRATAFFSIFPLDIYSTDRMEQLNRLRDDEKPIILFDNTGRLSNRYDKKKWDTTMLNIKFKRELCVICSAGGHLSEALELVSATNADKFIITKYEPHIAERLTDIETYYINNPHTSLWGYFINSIRSMFIFIRQRPKIILTTGAGIALAMCVIGKIYGSKVIYVESGARVTTTSKMGRFLYKHKIADIFYVQWESMLQHHPNAIYAGRLI